MLPYPVFNMAGEPSAQPPPRGLARFLMRAPIWLYRLGLGWLLGKRFLLLTHTGRKTGRPRQNVLEVVRHDRPTGVYIVASGWGEKSQWFRNIQKTPEVLIQVGSRRMEATTVRLSPAEGQRELLDYSRRYPFAFRAITRRMLGQAVPATEQECLRLAQWVPLMALRTKQRKL